MHDYARPHRLAMPFVSFSAAYIAVVALSTQPGSYNILFKAALIGVSGRLSLASYILLVLSRLLLASYLYLPS